MGPAATISSTLPSSPSSARGTGRRVSRRGGAPCNSTQLDMLSKHLTIPSTRDSAVRTAPNICMYMHMCTCACTCTCCVVHAHAQHVHVHAQQHVHVHAQLLL